MVHDGPRRAPSPKRASPESAFGEILDATSFEPTDWIFPHRAFGEVLDPNLGWRYLRARWMDPEVGRFVSRDPWEGMGIRPRTLHRFVYAEQDPVNRADPSGFATVAGSLTVSAAQTLTPIVVGPFLPFTRAAAAVRFSRVKVIVHSWANPVTGGPVPTNFTLDALQRAREIYFGHWISLDFWEPAAHRVPIPGTYLNDVQEFRTIDLNSPVTLFQGLVADAIAQTGDGLHLFPCAGINGGDATFNGFTVFVSSSIRFAVIQTDAVPLGDTIAHEVGHALMNSTLPGLDHSRFGASLPTNLMHGDPNLRAGVDLTPRQLARMRTGGPPLLQ